MTEILVNSTGSGGPISVLGVEGQVIVAWTENGIITCAGLPPPPATVGDPFTVNGDDAPATWPVLAMLPQGFAVAWTSGHDLFLQRMSADGRGIGARIRVNDADVDPGSPPAMARLLDGGLVVCWADATQETVRAQLFRGDLSRLGGRFTVNVPRDLVFELTGQGIPHGLANHQPTVTNLDVGDTGYAFVVAWQRGTAVETTTAHYRFFQPDGTPEPAPAGTPTNPDGTPMGYEHQARYDLLCRPGSLAARPGGGFSGLRLVGGVQGTDDVLAADSYDSTGGFRFSADITHVDDHTLSTLPMITSTPTNDFVVVWAEAAEHVSGDPGRNIRGMATGTAFGPTGAVTISSAPAGDHDAPRVTCVATDFGYNTAIAWLDGKTLKARVLRGNDLLHDA